MAIPQQQVCLTKGRPDSKTKLAPAKTKWDVQMAVHERKISKFLGLYNTGRPSNSGLGLRSANVERNYIDFSWSEQ